MSDATPSAISSPISEGGTLTPGAPSTYRGYSKFRTRTAPRKVRSYAPRHSPAVGSYGGVCPYFRVTPVPRSAAPSPQGARPHLERPRPAPGTSIFILRIWQGKVRRDPQRDQQRHFPGGQALARSALHLIRQCFSVNCFSKNLLLFQKPGKESCYTQVTHRSM